MLTALLKQVSRSFYLTLRVLPGAIRPQIGLAYLLARATDTIADTAVIPVAARLQALQALRERILGQRTMPLNFGEIARSRRREEAESVESVESVGAWERGGGGASERRSVSAGTCNDTMPHPGDHTSAERVLLERIEEILLLLNRFSSADQERIRGVLQTIISGQSLDLERFAGAMPEQIVALQSEQELDDYTYRVAGCVGEFWTRMCRAHLFPKARLDDALLLANGVRFGKGLQLVNILRDLPVDLRQGRCYLPAEPLGRVGLTPAALLEPANEAAFRPLYQEYLAQAQAHLAAGWAYANALPQRCVRVRLACAWPLLIGVRTLEHLRAGNILEVARRIKIGRGEVRSLVARSVLYYPWPKAWDRLFLGSGNAVASRRTFN